MVVVLKCLTDVGRMLTVISLLISVMFTSTLRTISS